MILFHDTSTVQNNSIQIQFYKASDLERSGLKRFWDKKTGLESLTKGPEYKRSGILQKTRQKRPGCKIFWTFVFKYPCRMFCSQTHKTSGLKRYGDKRCGHKRSGIRKVGRYKVWPCTKNERQWTEDGR